MGASRWSYWTEYDADFGRAFARLREHVFRSGDYIGAGGHRAFSNDPHPDPRREMIEDLLMGRAEAGTHSILDVVHFELEGGPRRAMQKTFVGGEAYEWPIVDGGVCRLASPDELREQVGTDRPSRALLEARGDLSELCHRGDAVCVVWDGDRPDAPYFFGSSGD